MKPGDNPLANVRGDLFDIIAELEITGVSLVMFQLRGIPIQYDVAKQEFSCDWLRAPCLAMGGRLRLRLLLDRGSIEIFGNGSHVAGSQRAFLRQKFLLLPKVCSRIVCKPRLLSLETRPTVTEQEAFGAVVRSFRLSLEMSQGALAEVAGVHRTYVGSVERGERNVSLQSIYAIARALGTTPGELFTQADKLIEDRAAT